MMYFVGAILFLIFISVVLVIDHSCDQRIRNIRENVTSYMLVNIEPVYRTRSVKTGSSTGFMKDNYIYMVHYSNVDELVGYKYHFQVYFKNGEVKHIATRVGTKMYSAIIEKMQIRGNREENTIFG